MIYDLVSEDKELYTVHVCGPSKSSNLYYRGGRLENIAKIMCFQDSYRCCKENKINYS